MKYCKPPLSIEDQVKLLAGRGMAFGDQAAAARTLEHVNYYRLRAYWLPFETAAAQKGQHLFAAGTQFETIVALYDFDRRLRSLVMEAVERIEVSLRTRVSFVLGMKYGAHAHLDQALFQNANEYLELIADMEKEIQRSKETFIQHYLSTYTDPAQPPIWAMVEITSLGTLSKLFAGLKLWADRKSIARAYDLDESVLSSFLHHLTIVRNICAHHCRLWNRRFPLRFKWPRNPSYLAGWVNEDADQELYNTLVMTWFLLRQISPDSSWLESVRQLVKTAPVAFEGPMGFPADWEQRYPWK